LPALASQASSGLAWIGFWAGACACAGTRRDAANKAANIRADSPNECGFIERAYFQEDLGIDLAPAKRIP